MHYLTNEIKEDIETHSQEDSPNECCGIIVLHGKDYSSMRCKNISNDKKLTFEIGPHDYLKAQKTGRIVAYYHSHPEDEDGAFSPADKLISESHGLPLLLYCSKIKKFIEYK